MLNKIKTGHDVDSDKMHLSLSVLIRADCDQPLVAMSAC